MQNEVAWCSELRNDGRDVQPTSNVRRMLVQVREPLLSVLQSGPNSVPRTALCCVWPPPSAVRMLLGARALLTELQHAQPSRP
jgi:hypothetical protein